MSEYLSDIALSRRLERAEATANARFVEARAERKPELGAAWIEVGGTYAMYDGPSSPCTQTFGLGIFELPGVREMERLESFFEQRGAPVFHEVSPLADASLLNLLCERRYCPVELSSVMYQPLRRREPLEPGPVEVRLIGPDEREKWTRTAMEGWIAEAAEFVDLLEDLMGVSASRDGVQSFLAEIDGEPVAAAALMVHEGVALLAGSSTIPRYRKQGAQRALLEARLQYSEQDGCDLAMMAAAPGSSSQRNAERQGFRIAYTRIKWKLVR